MSTKAVGSEERDDSVINEYKHAEGSLSEISVVKRAMQNSNHDHAKKIYNSLNGKRVLKLRRKFSPFWIK